MVRLDIKHGLIMLFAGVYQYGGIGQHTGASNAIHGIPMGHIICSAAIQNILGIADCLYTGKSSPTINIRHTWTAR